MPRLHKFPTRNRYTEEEQKQAVAILAQYGGGLSQEGMAAVAQKFPTASRSQLALWWNHWSPEVRPVALEIIAEDPESLRATTTMSESMLKSTNKILAHLNDDNTIARSGLKDAAIALGILIDKQMMQTGISPELFNKMRVFIAVMRQKGYDPQTHLDDLIEEYKTLPDAQDLQ